MKINNSAKFYNYADELVATAARNIITNNLYEMLFETILSDTANIAAVSSNKLWHERAGHINLKALRELSDRGMIDKINFMNSEKFFCEGCQYG